jgi:hypothetical protein
MNTFEYMHCDVPPGMDLREYRRTMVPQTQRRLHMPHLRWLSR